MQISVYQQAEAMKGGAKLDESAKNDESLLPKLHDTRMESCDIGNLCVTKQITAMLLEDSRPFVLVAVSDVTRTVGAGEDSNCRLAVLNSAQERRLSKFRRKRYKIYA